jgi:hypothetical protein
MMRTRSLLLGTLAFLPALPLLAQAPSNPFAGLTRFTGTVKAVAGDQLSVDIDNGGTATFELPDSLAVTKSVPATIGDLATGKFVGCTAVADGTDGKLRATECHIFPESMRGRGEGHNPMGPPNTTMTNGNITTTSGNVEAADNGKAGVVLHVAYQGGAQDIAVSPETQITQVMAGNASLLEPGVHVNGAARESPDGTARVQFLNIVP